MGKEFSYEIIEIIGVLDESHTSNWGTALCRISWNGKPPVYDIRSYDLSTLYTDKIRMGKGVSFTSDDAISKLIESLIEYGFGDSDSLTKIIKSRDDNKDDIFDLSEYDNDVIKIRSK